MYENEKPKQKLKVGFKTTKIHKVIASTER